MDVVGGAYVWSCEMCSEVGLWMFVADRMRCQCNEGISFRCRKCVLSVRPMPISMSDEITFSLALFYYY